MKATASVHREYLRVGDIVSEVLPIGRSTFYSWVAAGRLPPGKRLSSGVRVWSREEIHAAVSRMEAARERR